MTQDEEFSESFIPNHGHFAGDLDELFQDSPGVIGVHKATLGERVTHVAKLAKQVRERLESKGRATVQATDIAIHKHPYRSLGIALGTGLLVGALVSHRH